ncbi:MAG TPA: pyrroloquinoline quinone-dependent dehydrogenase [Vicinamibacteria bacterium]
MRWLGSAWLTAFLSILAACSALRLGPRLVPEPRVTSEWPSYGNDPGGMRYSPLDQIDKSNVTDLEEAWTFRHGDQSTGTGSISAATAFEATPILVEGQLIFCTPFNRVFALDPLTGGELWVFDPAIPLTVRYENQLVCRGVSAWTDSERQVGEMCRTRIFTGTNDARLFAIDARTGQPCPDFADGGQYDLAEERDVGRLRWKGEYQVTSPPAIFKDLVVVGAGVADNQRTNAPSGVVRAFDARTGELKWHQDFRPPDFDGPVSEVGYALGTPNVWSIMSVDEELGFVYVPTGNPAPDFYRGDYRDERSDMSYYGSSVVALSGDTGEIAWHFQTVHHDLWDYDVPAQPALYTFESDDGPVPALAQATKTGHLFLLDRRTGGPLFPVHERPVPQLGAEGQWLSPTQPFPERPPALAKQALRPDEIDPGSLNGPRCRALLESMVSDGIFSPPSVRGTILFPGSGGGLNWSGVAIDPERKVLVTNSTNIAWTVRLFPSSQYPEERRADPDGEVRPQDGTPFGMTRAFFTQTLAFSLLDIPCNPPPWGHLHAIDLRTGEPKWETTLGEIAGQEGLPSLGGAILTASGLAFISGTIKDDHLRAFDVETGAELWKARLPAGGQATPMTYEVRLEDGRRRQFVVIAAGGNGRASSKIGDSLVAFALPD